MDIVTRRSEMRMTSIGSIGPCLLLLHGEDDQVLPINASARQGITLLSNGKLKTCPALSHGLFATDPDLINADLLDFFEE